MALDVRSKKEIEQLALDAARNAGAPIPDGGEVGEEPDFRFHSATGSFRHRSFRVVAPRQHQSRNLAIGAGEFSSESLGGGPSRMRPTRVAITPGSGLLHKPEG